MNTTKENKVAQEAIELMVKKDHDYNHQISRDDYFPFGMLSYAQLLNMKNLRVRSLATRAEGETVYHESLRGSLLDLINYSIMAIIHLDNEDKKRDGSNKKDSLLSNSCQPNHTPPASSASYQ